MSFTGCNSQESSVSLSKDENKIHIKTIIAVGDSLTAGYNLQPNETYPAHLQELLDSKGYHYEVQNSGVSGETSAGTLARANWILNAKPDIIILTTGGNDALRGLSPTDLKSNIEKTIEIFQEANVQILLVGLMSPRNMGPLYTLKFDSVYPDIAEEYDLPFMPFLLQDVATIQALNQNDGIHPNNEGNKIIAENVFQYLEGLL
jgi:acyl-CoA thioesterase-1